MNIKIGLEKEFFLLSKVGDIPLVVPKLLPADESGVLVEARGKPFTNPIKAVFDLKAEIFRLDQLVKDQSFYLDDSPIMTIPRETMVKARRTYEKGLISYRNLYGFKHHRNRQTEQTAGIHISFTNEKTLSYNARITDGTYEKKKLVYYAQFDWATIFTELDKRYKERIKLAKRNPGFYELKSNGRIEYRSLPSNIDLDELICNLQEILKNL